MTSRKRAILPALAAAAVFGVVAAESRAVILYRSETRNTSAPTGAFANSGWQWQGKLKTGDGPNGIEYGYAATPIASKYFITAAHVGGSNDNAMHIGASTYHFDFTFNSASTPGYMTMPGTDLRIFKVQESFSSWAPLYSPSDGAETGKTMVVYGRGTQRGEAIYAETATGANSGNRPNDLKGWGDGLYDSVQSWGTNQVSAVLNGGPGIGNVLEFKFDRNGLTDEAALSNGDSGGGVFIQGAGGVWKLAGINFSREGNYRLSAPVSGIDTAAFQGAVFDKGGLYQDVGGGNYALNPDTFADQPAASYSTLISSNISWINSVINSPSGVQTPEPASMSLVLLSSTMLFRRRRSQR